MIVVADTSPINYLLLINQIDLLPRLFQQVIIPDVVCGEMRDLDAPLVLQQWIADPPSWLMIQPVPIMDTTLNAETLTKLQQTNFRVSRHIIQTLLNRAKP